MITIKHKQRENIQDEANTVNVRKFFFVNSGLVEALEMGG
jgi:hypothetical protein